MNKLKAAKENIRNYCSQQERCRLDVFRKIKSWELNETEKENLLKELTQERYLDEHRFCIYFCRGKFNLKKWGRLKITSELKKKKIPDYYIRKGLEEIKEEEYLQTIDYLLERKEKLITETNYYIKMKKLSNFLIQKGFESYLVWERIKLLKDK